MKAVKLNKDKCFGCGACVSIPSFAVNNILNISQTLLL